MIATQIAMSVLLVVLLVVRVWGLWDRRSKAPEASASVPAPTIVHVHAEPRSEIVTEETAETRTNVYYGPTGGAEVNADIAALDMGRQQRTARLQAHARELGKRLRSPAPLRLVDTPYESAEVVGLSDFLPETKPT